MRSAYVVEDEHAMLLGVLGPCGGRGARTCDARAAWWRMRAAAADSLSRRGLGESRRGLGESGAAAASTDPCAAAAPFDRRRRSRRALPRRAVPPSPPALAWASLELVGYVLIRPYFLLLLDNNPKLAADKKKRGETATQMLPRVVCFLHNVMQVGGWVVARGGAAPLRSCWLPRRHGNQQATKGGRHGARAPGRARASSAGSGGGGGASA
jgi:hypothetical protein